MYRHRDTETVRDRVNPRQPTLHPNMRDRELPVQATLQWQSTGVQSGLFTIGHMFPPKSTKKPEIKIPAGMVPGSVTGSRLTEPNASEEGKRGFHASFASSLPPLPLFQTATQLQPPPPYLFSPFFFSVSLPISLLLSLSPSPSSPTPSLTLIPLGLVVARAHPSRH